jgi:hypothetical protein
MTEEEAESAARTYYSELIQDVLSAWADAGRPSESFGPTLKSALLDEPTFSRTRLLGGKLKNLQPLMEYIGVLKSGPPPPTQDEVPVTTLDRACGVANVPRLDMLFARTLAFASQASRNEANAIAISIYAGEVLGLKFGSPIAPELLPEWNGTDVSLSRKVNQRLHELLDEDSIAFLLTLVYESISEIQYCSYTNIIRTDLFAECARYWREQIEWLGQETKKITVTSSKKLEEDSQQLDSEVSQIEADSGMTQVHALRMVYLFAMLDYSFFARKPPEADAEPYRVIHRAKGRKDDNVIYSNAFTSNQIDNQIAEAVDILAKSGVKSFPIADRSIVLMILKNLNSSFGNEGAKRFSELSYIAFDQQHKESNDPDFVVAAEFWASFRTLIDVERATQIGLPFEIEHFLGEIFVTFDKQGPRIRFLDGGAISPSTLHQMSRHLRSQF